MHGVGVDVHVSADIPRLGRLLGGSVTTGLQERLPRIFQPTRPGGRKSRESARALSGALCLSRDSHYRALRAGSAREERRYRRRVLTRRYTARVALPLGVQGATLSP
jgi:hypothetical protein